MIICDKCKSEFEESTETDVMTQKIVLFDKTFNLCNNCCGDIYKFITGKEPNFMND